MTRSQRLFSILQLLLITIAVRCVKTDKFNSDFEQFKKSLFSIRDLDISTIINQTLFGDWTNNHSCSIELDAIKNGLSNSEEWAFKILDARGKFPIGVLEQNFFNLGAFSECFHVDRNGNNYKTQYCVARLVLRSNEAIQAAHIMRAGLWGIRQSVAPSITLGICLPSVCPVMQLESSLNQIVQAKMEDMSVVIPEKHCQFTESSSDLKLIHFVAFGLIGLVALLMVASTGYDIFCTVYDREKYEPFLMFSNYTNCVRLFSCQQSKSPDSIECMNGIRVLTAIWVVYGHSYRYGFNFETTQAQKYLETYRAAFIFALMKVDTFFAIGALLASIKMFKLLQKNGQLKILSMFSHRYLRLTPLLAACILMFTSIPHFLGSGPLWPQRFSSIKKNCDRYWWSPLLYVQNYVNVTERCFPHTWFLNVDMQLYLCTPFIIYWIHRSKGKAFMGLLVLILIDIGYIVLTHINYEITDLYSPHRNIRDQYLTHTRFPAWFVGIIAGYIFVEFPTGSIRIPKKVNLCAWTLSIATVSFAVFGQHPYYQLKNPQSTALEFGLFEALARIAWPTAVCYIIFACARGCGGPVNLFLSHPVWQPFARLSYAVYLIHFPLIQILASSDSPPIFVELNAFEFFIGVCFISILLAIPATLAFVSPLDTIEKLIFVSHKKEKTPLLKKV